MKRVFRILVEYLFIFFVILECNSVYRYCITKDYKLPEISFIFLVLLCIVLVWEKQLPVQIIKRWIAFFIPYLSIIVIMVLFSVSKTVLGNFVMRFVLFLPLMVLIFELYSKFNERWTILFRFTDVMCILAAISLIFWILGSQLHILSPTGSVIADWGRVYHYPSYYGLYFERQTQTFLSFSGLRNDGIFTEAPMFSLCLTIALIIEIYIKGHEDCSDVRLNKIIYRKNILNRKIILLSVTILSTFSTTGMILLVVIFLLEFYSRQGKSKVLNILKWGIGILFFIVGGYIIFNMFSLKADSSSWRTRVDDYRAGIYAWKDQPLLGNGYAKTDAVKKYMSSFRSGNLGFSNSIFTILYQGGLVFFVLYIIPLWYYIKFSIKNHKKRLINVWIIFIILFITTIFQYTFVMLIFLAQGYSMLLNYYNVRCK